MAIGLTGFPDGLPAGPGPGQPGRPGPTGPRSARKPAGNPDGAEAPALTGWPARRVAGHTAQPFPAADGGQAAGRPGSVPVPDSRLLKKSLAQLEPHSEKFMAYFFAILFVRNPELRPMFPLALDTHRQRVFEALARYVWTSDRPESLEGWLCELVREHRKLGVKESHYRPFCDALLAAVWAFTDGCWPQPLQTAWERALDHLAAVMAGAAHGLENEPAWWLAEVIGHDLRRPGLAVLTLRPDRHLPYRPGQHVSVQVSRWPRVWREYSIANAPEGNDLLHLHVRAIPRGRVSQVLVHQSRPGDTLIVGPARGEMTADALSSRSVFCVAGGTGLAPVKAIVGALARPGRPQPCTDIRVLFGARREADLYDLPDLRAIAAGWPSVTVIPAVSDEPGYAGVRGALPQLAPCLVPPGTPDVVISGPPGMVTKTAKAIAACAPGARLHFDPPPGTTAWNDRVAEHPAG